MDAIDLKCHSVRDFLDLTAAVREAGVRDPLRTIEDCLLDLLAEVEEPPRLPPRKLCDPAI